MFNGRVNGMQMYTFDYRGKELIEGIYFVRMTKEDGTAVSSKIVLLRD
jgi:hypothetical protein